MVMYSKYPPKLVTMDVLHDGCWSSYMNSGEVKSLGRVIYQDKNLVRAIVMVDKKTFKFLKQQRDRGNIKDIINVRQYNNFILVDIIEKFSGSILSILQHNDVLILDVNKKQGLEKWRFIGYEYQIHRIINEVSEVGRIKKMETSDFDYKHLGLKAETLKLTEIEQLILELSLSLGYFDYPKKITIKELSKAIGINESTLTYHIRNIQKKVFRKVLHDIKKENYLSTT